jgi:hypothetical protein
MEKGVQTMFATILGAVLLLVGIIGFVSNPVLGIFDVNGLHNAVHLLSGAVLVGLGVWGSTASARTGNRAFGIIYGLVAILGFAGLAGFLVVNGADNILHTLIALASLIVGFGVKE